MFQFSRKRPAPSSGDEAAEATRKRPAPSGGDEAAEAKRARSSISSADAVSLLPPSPPSLIYTQTSTLVFSFLPLCEDPDFTYELGCRYRLAGTIWQEEDIVLFDGSSLAVRVPKGGGSWSVTLSKLHSGYTYYLRLRGVLPNGTRTEWSGWSDPMRMDEGGSPICEAELGVNERQPVLDHLVAVGPTYRSVTAPAQDVSAPSTLQQVSNKFDELITRVMALALSGIDLADWKMVPSVHARAEALKQQYGSHALAMALRTRDDALWRQGLEQHIIGCLPTVGRPTHMLLGLWRNIRCCALIARLCGHDVNNPKVQALILSCLCSTSELSAGAAIGVNIVQPEGAASDANYGQRELKDVVARVATVLAKETFRSMARPFLMADALEYIGKQLLHQDDCAKRRDPCTTLDAAVNNNLEDEVEGSGPARVALEVFGHCNMEERSFVVIGLAVVWLMPILLSTMDFMMTRILPRMTAEIAASASVGVVLFFQTVVYALGIATAFLLQLVPVDVWARLPSTTVFLIYAGMPVVSTCLAARSVVNASIAAPELACLGLFNLCSTYLRWTKDLADQDASERSTRTQALIDWSPGVQTARKCLLCCLVITFIWWHVMALMVGSGLRTSKEMLRFVLSVAAALSQTKLMELLRRRVVLLRILGAKEMMLAGVALFLSGAMAVLQPCQSYAFLQQVSPTPPWCLTVIVIKQHSFPLGLQLGLIVHLLSRGSVTPLALALPCVAAFVYYIRTASTSISAGLGQQLQSSARVLYLLPGVTRAVRRGFAQAGGKLKQQVAMVGLRNAGRHAPGLLRRLLWQ